MFRGPGKDVSGGKIEPRQRTIPEAEGIRGLEIYVLKTAMLALEGLQISEIEEKVKE